jgi:hypothetical protein
MAFDKHKNLALGVVAAAPAPAEAGTTLAVATGQGALFPDAPFNCTVWLAGAVPLASNAEIVRVVAKAGDVFTIERTQEGTAARAIQAGDQICNALTAKLLEDIEGAIADQGQVCFYEGSDPWAAGLTPRYRDKPALAYAKDGHGPTCGWNPETGTWV